MKKFRHYRRQFGIACGLSLSFCSGSVLAYKSTYDTIQWEPRSKDTSYCIDLTDENWNIFPGFQKIACGENLYKFSPRTYVQDALGLNPDTPEFKGITFWWRVRSASGYGDKGFEGEVTIGSDCGLPYRSDSELVQWGCRFNDTFYCLDLFDAEDRLIKAPFVCGEHKHSFSPSRLKELNLPAGNYRWKVWSHNAYDYAGHQAFFDGQFQYEPSNNNSSGSSSWSQDDENGSAEWTDSEGNGSANWNHGEEKGSAEWTDNEGNGSTNWSHGDENGSVEWTDNEGNGSTNWNHGDEKGSAEWASDDCNGSTSWSYGGWNGSVSWADDDCSTN